jgi:hypothetical protein
MDTTSIILKTDSRGRVRMPLRRREELLLEFERSGLPATKFAQLAGVRYQTFATWVQKHKKQRATTGAAASAAPLRFAEVVPAAATHSCGMLRVLLPGGAVIEVADGAQAEVAAQLLKALA